VYSTRILPVDEWPRLAGTSVGQVWPYLRPMRNTVVVVEHDGEIVGSLVLMQTLHAEFLEIAPDYRGHVAVARKLRAGMTAEAERLGYPTVLASAISDEMRGILAGLGASQLPGDHYVLSVKGVQ
jgi:hypothetical protein